MSIDSMQKLQFLGSLEWATMSTSMPLIGASITAAALSSIVYIHNKLPPVPKSGPARPQELLDALDNNEDVYYFGVGSNLSRSKLESRSICGKKIHPISMEPCLIHDCRLAFNLRGFPPVEPAFGSLEPLPSFYEKNNGDKATATTDRTTGILQRSDSKALVAYSEKECHGALIKLSAEDYKLVHRSEGGEMGALCGYEEIMVECVPYDKSKPPVMAVAFRAREHVSAKGEEPCPSKRYMNIIREGAAELGLEDSYQLWLKNHPVQDPSLITKKVGKYCTLFSFTMGISSIQSTLLFEVYVLPTDSRWRRIVSEIASVIIMLPGACLGLTLKKVLEITGLMPPEMKKWMEGMD